MAGAGGLSLIRYRDARPEDATGLAGLHRQSFVETFAHLYRPGDLNAFLATLGEEKLRAELSDGRHYVRFAEDEGEPVGFVKLGPVTLPVQPLRPALELRQLYLLAAWQGAGVARTLADWALGLARELGAEEVYLSVYKDNHRAKAFYRRYGFAYVGPYAFMVGEQADEDEIWRLELK
jgi:ribosomal protein S18 acetylase RimI-like enzyme